MGLIMKGCSLAFLQAQVYLLEDEGILITGQVSS